jgi:hypothetical protein
VCEADPERNIITLEEIGELRVVDIAIKEQVIWLIRVHQ